MDQIKTPLIKDLFPITLSCYSNFDPTGVSVSDFPQWLETDPQVAQSYPFLPDLARLEMVVATVQNSRLIVDSLMEERVINPTLELLQLEWKHLTTFFQGPVTTPEKGEEIILVYLARDSEDPCVVNAANNDLLALKIVAEALDIETVTQETGISPHDIHQILAGAVSKSLILKPVSKLERPDDFPGTSPEVLNTYRRTEYFTLQWHITQRCDLSCRHCYDRSDRQDVSLEQGLSILDQLEQFGRANRVRSQVSFTGGNPLLHPRFIEIYSAAVKHGFMTAILGNPMPEPHIQQIVDIQRPEFYQISLEGLGPHNDYIRGKGSYARALDFLKVLRRHGIYSMVMLTLTNANMDQVLPLAEILKDQADLFTFNRLSMVGEGTALVSADIDSYRDFLEAYSLASRDNPILSFKDSLFNILQFEKDQPLRGGCTGFGCGAAFNFVSLLPDGEVHACRKFPSKIGNLRQNTLQKIYNSATARAYRRGASGCDSCGIRPVCGGCLAVSYGFGQDIFQESDPYCFIKRSNSLPASEN